MSNNIRAMYAVAQVMKHLDEMGDKARVGLAAPTYAHAKDLLLGENGLVTLFAREFTTVSEQRLEAHHVKGGVVRAYSMERSRKFSGPQHSQVWIDVSRREAELFESWRCLRFGLRLGKREEIITVERESIPAPLGPPAALTRNDEASQLALIHFIENQCLEGLRELETPIPDDKRVHMDSELEMSRRQYIKVDYLQALIETCKLRQNILGLSLPPILRVENDTGVRVEPDALKHTLSLGKRGPE